MSLAVIIIRARRRSVARRIGSGSIASCLAVIIIRARRRSIARRIGSGSIADCLAVVLSRTVGICPIFQLLILQACLYPVSIHVGFLTHS